MLLCDRQIKKLCLDVEKPMLDPFIDRQVRTDTDNKRVISYGLSSCGYDARLAPEYFLFDPASNNWGVIDPLSPPDESCFERHGGDYIIIPPNGYILGRTIEYFSMPDDVAATCVGKSTLARCGAIVNVTPIEPGWCGYVTLEIGNITPVPLKLYANMGIAQFLFHKIDRPDVTYGDRGGKYQNQTSITLPRV